MIYFQKNQKTQIKKEENKTSIIPSSRENHCFLLSVIPALFLFILNTFFNKNGITLYVLFCHLTISCQHFPMSFHFLLFLKILFICLFIYFWLHWVLIAERRPSLVAASRLLIAVLLWSTGSRHRASVVVAHRLQSTASAVVAHGLSCSTACGIFPDQGPSPGPLHWQADS